jgi:hypothetical protein
MSTSAVLNPEQTRAYAGADPAGLITLLAGIYFPITPARDVASWQNRTRQQLHALADRVRERQLGPAAAADMLDRWAYGCGTQTTRYTSRIVDLLNAASDNPDPALVAQARRLLRQHAPAARRAARARAATPPGPATAPEPEPEPEPGSADRAGTAELTEPSGEVTGLTQCIAYAENLAAAAGQHGPDGNEGYLAQLAASHVTGEALTSGHDMQAAFAVAAAAATWHSTELGKQTSVQEAYSVNPDAGDKSYLTGDTGSGSPATDSDDVRTAMTASPSTPGPADADTGTPLPDAAGLTQTGAEHWHGSDVVTAASGDGAAAVGRCQYPDSAPYTVLATRPPGHRWEPDSNANGIDPALSAQEAARLADTLDELADLAESGTPAKPLTKLEKVAARVRELLGDSGVTIAGDDGEIEVSAADMRRILDAAVPEPAVATRRKVDAQDCKQDGMDTGAVWAELDTSGPEPTIAVTSTEGETPEEYPEGYTTTRLSPAEARQLAGTVRQFAATDPQTAAAAAAVPAPAAGSPDPVVEQVRDAYHRLADRPEGYVPLTALRDALPDVDHAQVDKALQTLLDDGGKLEPEALGHRIGDRERQAAIHIGGDDRHYLVLKPSADEPAPTPRPAAEAAAPAPAGPRRVTSPRGRVYEYDPDSGSTAVIEPDGWRAVVPAGSTTGVAARLLVWREEIKAGRGEDATADGARALLATMTGAELREVADAIGTTAAAARTKAQLVDAIVNSAVASPLKHRGLAQGWW